MFHSMCVGYWGGLSLRQHVCSLCRFPHDWQRLSLSRIPSVAVARRSRPTQLCGATTRPSMRSSYHPPCLMSTCPTWWWRAWTRSVLPVCMQMYFGGGCLKLQWSGFLICSWFPTLGDWIDGWCVFAWSWTWKRKILMPSQIFSAIVHKGGYHCLKLARWKVLHKQI